jgi:hypothetical protein
MLQCWPVNVLQRMGRRELHCNNVLALVQLLKLPPEADRVVPTVVGWRPNSVPISPLNDAHAAQ